MNIISFSLWGSDPKYTIGAVENMKQQPEIYPGWQARFYIDETVPSDTIEALRGMGADIVSKPRSDGFEGLFWRFEPAFDASIDRFIVRDCDSRLNAREAAAVQEWIISDLPFHCMRDHRGHDIIVLGAMWGAKSFFIPDFKDLYDVFVEQIQRDHIIKRAKYFYTDQLFLNKVIWPRIKDQAMVHDDLRRFTGLERPFTVKLPGGLFIGQQYGADNKPLSVPI